MTFYTYMMRPYKTRLTREGDLARDMEKDKERFPRNAVCKFDGWYRIIHNYLTQNGVCEKCWKEYVQCEKSRSSKSSSAR